MPDTQDRLNSWIESFPYEEAKAEVEGLNSEIQKLRSRIYALQNLIGVYERVRHSPSNAAQPELRVPVEAPTVPAKPSVREAIRTLMAEHPERSWTSDQLWGLLTQRGWLRTDPQGKGNMFAMLSVMTSQGQIERVKRGVYRLQTETPAEVAQ